MIDLIRNWWAKRARPKIRRIERPRSRWRRFYMSCGHILTDYNVGSYYRRVRVGERLNCWRCQLEKREKNE